MKFAELYPYWDDAHLELVDMVRLLKELQLDSDPGPTGRDLRAILLDFVRSERYWIGYLVAGYPENRPRTEDFPDGPSLAEALITTREISRRVLEPLGFDGLRAVRTVPGDPQTNRHETNMPIGGIFWHILELELLCRGRMLQRLEDEKARG